MLYCMVIDTSRRITNSRVNMAVGDGLPHIWHVQLVMLTHAGRYQASLYQNCPIRCLCAHAFHYLIDLLPLAIKDIINV